MMDADETIMTQRIQWIRDKLREAEDKYEFANGYRAGLECAVLALEGRDTLGQSIDPAPKKKRKPTL